MSLTAAFIVQALMYGIGASITALIAVTWLEDHRAWRTVFMVISAIFIALTLNTFLQYVFDPESLLFIQPQTKTSSL